MSLTQQQWVEAVMAEDYPLVVHQSWKSSYHAPEGVVSSSVHLHETGVQSASFYIKCPNAEVFLSYAHYQGLISVDIAAEEQRVIDGLLHDYREEYPTPDLELTESLVPFTFWWVSQHGPESVTRKLSVSPFARIRANYQLPGLAEMMAWREPPEGAGKLILWHGSPGTGKTYALRAIASQWRDWCKADYITDAEQFFANAKYMMNVLLQDADEDEAPSLVTEANAKKWRLLVFEDAGELLDPDAKEKVGQALSRLLNTTEGLIGQGLKILILITTNEKISNLHPAVTRPGRCLAEIGFRALTVAEARQWLDDTGHADVPTPKKALTLGELYSLTGTQKLSDIEEKVLLGLGR